MTKTEARKLAKSLVGSKMGSPSGTGTVTRVWIDQFGTAWIGLTVEGAGFNGSTLKTAVKVGRDTTLDKH